jgi:hypothetical protein
MWLAVAALDVAVAMTTPGWEELAVTAPITPEKSVKLFASVESVEI